MYTQTKLTIVALIDFIQYATFDELQNIIDKLIVSKSFTDSRVLLLLNDIFKNFDRDQVNDLIYKILVTTAEEKSDEGALLLKQIAIADQLHEQNHEEILIGQLQRLSENKVWHCKILLRTMLKINAKDPKYFDDLFKILNQMLQSGICQSLRSASADTWHNLKLGLAVFIITAGQTSEQKQRMKELFTKSIPAEIQSEMLEERRFEGLRGFMKGSE